MDVSSISLNRSTFEERHKNIGFLRTLYSLFALELIVALLWSSWVLTNDSLGNWVTKYWGIALVTGIIAILLILVATFLPQARQTPINLVIYFLFTLCFAYTMGYLCRVDWLNGWQIVYYCLWILTGIAVAFAVYAWLTTTYMNTISAMAIILGVAFLIFFGFLLFTKISFIKLLLAMIPVVIFGFYLNSDIRKMVRGNLYDTFREDPISGAVRIWMETVFVFCRLIELIGGMFFKSKH